MCSERLQPRAQSEEDPAAGLIQSYFVVGLRVSSLHVSTWEEQQTVLLADRHGLEFQRICSLEQITKLTRVPVSSSANLCGLNTISQVEMPACRQRIQNGSCLLSSHPAPASGQDRI